MNHKRQPHPVKLAQMQASMAGVANSHAILDADSDVDGDGTDTFDFEEEDKIVFSFIPDGDATFSEMEEAGESVDADRLNATYGDRIPVPGRFTKLVVASGKVNIYKVAL